MIVWFDEREHQEKIGGKGLNLCRLAQAGLPVPPGFCVTVEGLIAIGLPEIECALSRLGAKAVAVRSSAVVEDTAAASFAGIHVTRLNVRTASGVVQALREIRESALMPAAVAYRQKKRISAPPRMAAVVQTFVTADAAGVLFMRDPLDGSERILVEGSWGSGEAVVGGAVTPDRWVLSQDGEVISTHVSNKDVAAVPDVNGVKHVEVEPPRRRLACLGEPSLRNLVDLARCCERLFGCPQDIEWAEASGRIWILQSRPITQPVSIEQT
jgi:pyruvate,water dikinase